MITNECSDTDDENTNWQVMTSTKRKKTTSLNQNNKRSKQDDNLPTISTNKYAELSIDDDSDVDRER